MRSVEDKGCLSNGPTARAASQSQHHPNRTALGKPTPSKWDDAQKWLVNLSRPGADKNHPKASPRNSNADDLRLIAPVPKKDYSSADEEEEEAEEREKNIVPAAAARPICLRDMGTEMTPIASQEPSRAATPVRATSPMSSGSSTPVGRRNGAAAGFKTCERECVDAGESKQFGHVPNGAEINKTADERQPGKKLDSLEIKAMAWEEAERVKNMARFKREEAKIQAWESHRKRKAEMENRKVEVKAERLKSRAQEKYNTKIAATRRIAEEKRANAEAKLQEKALKTSERADYIRRNGHLPSSCFSFKCSSLCW